MAQGKRPDIDGLAALCAWSSLAADDYIRARASGRLLDGAEPEALR
jgi:hypothetical protein